MPTVNSNPTAPAFVVNGVPSSDIQPLVLELEGISLGGPTGPHNSSMGAHLRIGIIRSDAQGFPSTPSLNISQRNYWRFRWGVKAGQHSISIRVKQTENTTPYPSMIVRANTDIGVNTDMTATSPGSTDWTTIGPIIVNPTSPGVLWVELYNNTGTYNAANGNVVPYAPAYFDHIVTT